jgi:hypothetical protein
MSQSDSPIDHQPGGPSVGQKFDPVSSRRNFLSMGAASAIAMSVSGCFGDGDDANATGSTPPATPPVQLPTTLFAQARQVLSDPMLQNPQADSVRVVWFTEGEGGEHYVRAGAMFERRFDAVTTPMTRMLEDRDSQVFQTITAGLDTPGRRRIFRHEATVTGLTAGTRVPYVAISALPNGTTVRSETFSLQPLPRNGQALRLLLSSDQQNFPMAAANFQKVEETFGQVDAVLFPGDFVSQPNRASEWFDRANNSNPSFFQSLQGTMQRWNSAAVYKGGKILQNAALYGCLGNHEQPGRWRLDPATNNPNNTGPVTINGMDNDPQPRWYAEARYEELKAQINPSNDPAFRERWIEDNSFEWTTYREMWSLPEGPQGKQYWAQRYGDVFLISLNANRIWRVWNPNQRGKFTEQVPSGSAQVTQSTDNWGFGDFTFVPFGRGSQQYRWLEQVLQSEAARTAKYRIVMSHQTMAGLGDNAVPVLAEQRITAELTNGALIGPFPASQWPVRWPQVRDAIAANAVKYMRYEYPLNDDTWRNDIEPLLLRHNVNLVHTGHSHLWNRTRNGSLHYLETSNVGNSFGAMFFPTAQPGASPTQGPRPNQPGSPNWRNATITGGPRTSLEWNPADYPTTLDPHGREAIMPTIMNPMRELQGAPVNVPFVSSNALTAFSVFETQSGLVSSYVFDTRRTDAPTTKFDEFSILS